MTTLAEIARELGSASVKGDEAIAVTGVTHDSREVRPGDLFAVLAGQKTDGRHFVDDALKRGARALVVAAPLDIKVPQIIVADPRGELGIIAAACYGHPSDELKVVGITGTNGKTTSTYLVESALLSASARPGVIGTVEYRFGTKRWPAHHTTPEATVVQSVMREMKDAGATHVVMEVSSHGLKLGRLCGTRFSVVAFTNLTQDHLDFHGDMSDYRATKLKLFTEAIRDNPAAQAVVNIDDPFAAEILSTLTHPALTISIDQNSKADFHPLSEPRYAIGGLYAELKTPGGVLPISSPLVGEHNLSNIALAFGICAALELDLHSVARGLKSFSAVPGRLERVPHSGGFAVFVDYAHTPDALERVLDTLRPLTSGRIICVFGCGGDRDPDKRPKMGRAVGDRADLAIITSDNPRSEDPLAIIEMILPGIEASHLPRRSDVEQARAKREYLVEVDRGAAIDLAIQSANKGDTVLIAGKGHEDYQIFKTERIHFDDREHAQHALTRRKRGDRG